MRRTSVPLLLAAFLSLPICFHASPFYFSLPVETVGEGRIELDLSGKYGAGLYTADLQSRQIALPGNGIDSASQQQVLLSVRAGITRDLDISLLAPVILKDDAYAGVGRMRGGGLGDISVLLRQQFEKENPFFPSVSFAAGAKCPTGLSRFSMAKNYEEWTSPNGALELVTALLLKKTYGRATYAFEGGFSLPAPYYPDAFMGEDLSALPQDQRYYQPGTQVLLTLGVAYALDDSISLTLESVNSLANDDYFRAANPSGYFDNGRATLLTVYPGLCWNMTQGLALKAGLGYDIYVRNGFGLLRAFAGLSALVF